MPQYAVMPERYRIAVLGAGNMGSALIGGILKSGLADTQSLVATTYSQASADRLRQRFLIPATAQGNAEAVRSADVIIVAVKPPKIPALLREIREDLRDEQILVSVAAAVPIARIEQVLVREMPIFRAMPNIPVVVDEGATAIACNLRVTPEQRNLVERIFSGVGVACFVDEELMHVVTALSGSGPAYAYMVIEALIAGGVKMGLPREISTKLAEQTMLGAAKLVRETGEHPAVLRDQVITPGGVTISAIHELERGGLRAMLISAIETATHHSVQLMSRLDAGSKG